MPETRAASYCLLLCANLVHYGGACSTRLSLGCYAAQWLVGLRPPALYLRFITPSTQSIKMRVIIMMHKTIGYLVAVVIIAGVGSGWYFWQHQSNPLPRAQNMAVAVQVAKAATTTIPNHLEAMGTLQAQQSTNISADVAGKVTAILYQPGSFVKQGTPLIQLDDRTYRSDLDSANAALALAKVTYARNQSLAQVGAQSKQILDQSQADYLQAQAKLKSAQTLLEETTIRAPFDGYVGAKTVNAGDYVQAGQTLTVLVNRQQLQANYQFSEKYLPKLKLGQAVTITLPNQPKKNRRHYTGTVSYIAPEVDANTHSVVVQADVPNPDNTLAPGLLVKIEQSTGVSETGVVVPESSIVPTITGSQVYRVVNGKAQSVPVQTGETFDNRVQILSGVRPGDVVIVSGQQMVNDGTVVNEIQP